MASMHTQTYATGKKSYVIRWRDPATGKNLGKRFTYYDDARRFKTKVERDLDTGTYVDPSLSKVSVKDFLDHYIATAPIAASTRKLYETHARLHIVPNVGAKGIGNVSAADVRLMLARLVNEGVGQSTVVHVHQLIRAAFTMAVQEDRIQRNPASGIKLAKTQQREPFFLTAEQVSRLAAHAGPYALMVKFMAYTGLRVGEATTLRVRNISTLRRGIKVVEGGGTDGATKNRKVRSVPFPSTIVDELAAHLVGKGPDDYVFTAADGGKVIPNNWRKRVLYRAAVEADVLRDGEPPHPHDLRHTAASLWAAAGFSLHEVSRMLGHSGIAITSKTYIHLFPDEQDAKMDRFGLMLTEGDTTYGEVIEM